MHSSHIPKSYFKGGRVPLVHGSRIVQVPKLYAEMARDFIEHCYDQNPHIVAMREAIFANASDEEIERLSVAIDEHVGVYADNLLRTQQYQANHNRLTVN